MRPSEALELVEEMQRHAGGEVERARVFSERYPAFAAEYPELFRMAIRDGLHMDMLRYMVGKLEADGPSEETDREVGEQLAQRYLYPVVGGPEQRQQQEERQERQQRQQRQQHEGRQEQQEPGGEQPKSKRSRLC